LAPQVAWNLVFRKTLGQAERTLVSELRDVRNKWAHQKPFSSDDAYRALDSADRLLTAVSASQAADVNKIKNELLRVRYDEEMRTEKRKSAGAAIESTVSTNLKPWREVVTPHKDVASGRYQQAEFAADLWQVHLGEGTDEYKNPAEFFRRTYVTQSLKHLLIGAVQRLSEQGGDPVVQLQTNFGGGKTHSMMALYHLFSNTPQGELAGIDEVLKEAGTSKPSKVNRVVLVGNKISPGNPVTKSDGTVVRTLWGEMAWQMGFVVGGIKEAKKAFSRIAADDEKATSPGDALRELMNTYSPCLILIDEWVAYARQLHDKSDLPAGSFETHFTFAQALTESAKLARQCLLVISLGRLTWEQETFAYADSFDETASRYVGLRLGETVSLSTGMTGLLVKPEVARGQRQAERPPEKPSSEDKTESEGGGNDGGGDKQREPPEPPAPPVLRRFHGSVNLDPTRLGRDAGRVADEVVSHLAGLMGADVSITLEIQAGVVNGVPEKIVRIVNENCRTLKFTQAGFEEQ
jgi:hypothetical protein